MYQIPHHPNITDNNDSETSIISDECCHNDPVDDSIKQYLMKCGNCVLENCTQTRYDYSHEFHSCEMLEMMNEKWKSEVIISFSIYKKIIMNGFIEWQLWIKNLFSNEVVSNYRRLKKERKKEIEHQR